MNENNFITTDLASKRHRVGTAHSMRLPRQDTPKLKEYDNKQMPLTRNSILNVTRVLCKNNG